MSVTGMRVSCWGRSYDFTESLLPRNVQSQGEDILAGPITLVIRSGGHEVVFRKADKQAIAPAPHQVDLDAAASALGLAVRVKTHLEYDGCQDRTDPCRRPNLCCWRAWNFAPRQAEPGLVLPLVRGHPRPKADQFRRLAVGRYQVALQAAAMAGRR